MASVPSKWVTLIIPLSLWKRKRSHRARSGEQGGCSSTVMFFPARWCSSRPGTAGCSGHWEQVHCRGEAATICPATTLVSSCALNEAKAAGSLCRLADWSSGPVARTHCGRCLWHRRTWSTWLWLSILTVLLSSASVTSETSTDSSGAWFLGCTQKSIHQWWLHKASLVQFEDARWCPDTPSTCMWRSWSSVSILGTIFAQTFRMRGGVNKSMWNKIWWLQKAKITVVYSQDITLDDNTIHFSLFRQ